MKKDAKIGEKERLRIAREKSLFEVKQKKTKIKKEDEIFQMKKKNKITKIIFTIRKRCC